MVRKSQSLSPAHKRDAVLRLLQGETASKLVEVRTLRSGEAVELR